MTEKHLHLYIRKKRAPLDLMNPWGYLDLLTANRVHMAELELKRKALSHITNSLYSCMGLLLDLFISRTIQDYNANIYITDKY